MPLHNLMLRRKKVGKVFPVKISTMDAELEFSLDYKVIFPIIVFFLVTTNTFPGNWTGTLRPCLSDNRAQRNLVNMIQAAIESIGGLGYT